jgi:uncharacterized protein (DUF1697 family)
VAKRIALLRAINVGGRTKLAMSELRRLFADLGCKNPQTILQTGNVVFEAKAVAGLAARIEEALANEAGVKTDIILRSGRDWEKMIAANPYPDQAEKGANWLVLMPLKDKPAKGALDRLREAIKGRETVEMVGDNLYIVYPDGIGRSKFTLDLIEKRLGTRGTGRNWNTVLKIADAAKAV